MNHMYCHGLGSGLWSTRLVPAGVCWPHEDVLDRTWELPLKFRDGKGELLCFWFLFLWCASPLRMLPGGILAADVLHLGCTLHLSPHWSPTPSIYGSHLALHCCLPSCISHWVMWKRQTPPMPFLPKTCHISFFSIVTHLLEGSRLLP